MKRLWVLVLFLSIGPVATGQISLNVCEADGETPFDCNDDIMVGTKLTIIVSSDSNEYWSGGVFIDGNDRDLGTLAGKGLDANDPNARDYTDSHYEDAGNFAKVTAWKDSLIWGFDLFTYYPVDGNSKDNSTVPGDWFIIEHEANQVGDCNIGFYDYNTSWKESNSFLNFSHSPTRDLSSDDKVNFTDYALFTSQWDVNDCEAPDWCEGADLDRDSNVDCNDLELFVEYWLWELNSEMPAGGRNCGMGSGLEESISFLEPDDNCEETNGNGGYAYVITVGGTEGDFYSINGAIEAMMQNELDLCRRGCIQVYPGTYAEQLNYFYPGGHNLPAHCDLIGMGINPDDVVIQHKRREANDPNFTDYASEIYAYGIFCDGDNTIENLKIENVQLSKNQNGVRFQKSGTLRNCIIRSYHDAVTAFGHLVVSGCNIEGWVRPCIHAYSTFAISDCIFYPHTITYSGEHPAGIKVTKSGTIDNVRIEGNVTSSDYEPHYDTPWLAGIILQLRNPEDTVTISNAIINLKLTTLYRPNQSADWELFGIVSGDRNPVPTTAYPGHAIVEDCQINLTGIEDCSGPNGDGRAIMVAGVCVQGGGKVDVIGNTYITTSRTSASYGEEGYEYSLNNQNGTLAVDPVTIDYDDKLTNGIITELK